MPAYTQVVLSTNPLFTGFQVVLNITIPPHSDAPPDVRQDNRIIPVIIVPSREIAQAIKSSIPSSLLESLVDFTNNAALLAHEVAISDERDTELQQQLEQRISAANLQLREQVNLIREKANETALSLSKSNPVKSLLK